MTEIPPPQPSNPENNLKNAISNHEEIEDYCLKHLFSEPIIQNSENTSEQIALLPENFFLFQKNDPDYRDIIKGLLEPSTATRKIHRILHKYELLNNLLIRKLNNNTCALMVPNCLRRFFLNAAHDLPVTGSHGGYEKTLGKLQHYDWFTKVKDCKNYCKSCDKCQRAKPLTGKRQGLLEPTKLEPKFWRLVLMDLGGPYQPSAIESGGGSGYKWVISLVCGFSKYWVAKCIKDATAKTVGKFLYETFAVYGIPKILKSNNGPQFIEQSMQEFLRLLGVTQKFSPFYTPRVNDQVERMFQTLQNVIRTYVENNPKNWATFVLPAVSAYNITPHKKTRVSPYFLVFGQHPTLLPSPEIRGPCENPVNTDRLHALDQVRKDVMARILTAQTNMKNRMNANRRQVAFQFGEQVLIAKPVKKKGQTSKFFYKNFGPYIVTRKLTDNVYLVEQNPLDPSSKKEQVHAEKLRRYFDPSFYRKSLRSDYFEEEFPNPEFYDPDTYLDYLETEE